MDPAHPKSLAHMKMVVVMMMIHANDNRDDGENDDKTKENKNMIATDTIQPLALSWQSAKLNPPQNTTPLKSARDIDPF